MIVCNSNNFAVIRPPKTGSTSLVFYFFKSGLLTPLDVYAIENGVFENWEAFEKYYQKFGDNYSHISSADIGKSKYKNVHMTFNELLQEGLVTKTMPCVSTIRNPIERYSSAFYFVRENKSLTVNKSEYANPNIFWDALKNKGNGFGIEAISRPQADYFPEHAELFNTENLHEHVSKYILEKGGKVDGRIEMRKNPDNKLDVFLAELTPDRKQDILDTYAKDFVLWEKAYAVYN